MPIVKFHVNCYALSNFQNLSIKRGSEESKFIYIAVGKFIGIIYQLISLVTYIMDALNNETHNLRWRCYDWSRGGTT